MSRRLWLAATSAWLGLALAGLFFYPLASAIDAGAYYLQWQPAHTAEAAVAWLVLALVIGVLVFLTWPSRGPGGTLALALVTGLPLLSLLAGLSRQLPGADALRQAWEDPAIRYGVPALAAALCLGLALVGRALLARALRGVVVALSPIALVVAFSVLTPPAVSPIRVAGRPGDAPPAPEASCPSVLALLFDELSFEYLYDGRAVRDEFPEIRRFGAMATHHLAARGPGGETLRSVPGFLAGRPLDDVRVERDHLEHTLDGRRTVFSAREPDGLFASARAAGFVTEAAGYYLPYCDLLDSVVDACRSLSFYNAATADTAFSPWHPIATTFILWPRQFPFGLFKNPPFARLQRALVSETAAFAQRPLPALPPTFRFVHFSIPHLPFVFDADGYAPPFDPLRQQPDDAYVRQLHYVDRLFGDIVAGLRRDGAFERTTIAVFSDHGFRGGGRERDVHHVPFLVKHAGQTTRADVRTEERAERLLHGLTRNCQAPRS